MGNRVEVCAVIQPKFEGCQLHSDDQKKKNWNEKGGGGQTKLRGGEGNLQLAFMYCWRSILRDTVTVACF